MHFHGNLVSEEEKTDGVIEKRERMDQRVAYFLYASP